MLCLVDILSAWEEQEAAVKGRTTHIGFSIFCMLPILHDVARVGRKINTKHFQTKLFYLFFSLFALF